MFVASREMPRIPSVSTSSSSLSSGGPSSPSSNERHDIRRLVDVNLRIPAGSLTAIVGAVGSGKSSLLSAILGEMPLTDGDVAVTGRVAYCAQQAWIQNATVRDNVTFGSVVDQNKYRRAVRDCALERDLEILPAGDMTEIGFEILLVLLVHLAYEFLQ